MRDGGETLVNLNNAGSSQMHPDALVAMRTFMSAEVRLGGYEAAARSQDEIKATYDTLRDLVGADQNIDIAFMDSATRAWNYFLYSLPLPRDSRILTAPTEFGSNLLSLRQHADHCGAMLELIDTHPDGTISLADLESRLSSDVSLVAISHVAMHGGIVNPVEEIGRLIRAHTPKTIYLVDGCQSVGAMPVDVRSIQCDALTATGRKWLRAPRGTGFLYVRGATAERIVPLTVDLSTAKPLERIDASLRFVPGARRLETWERSVSGFLGLGAAAAALLDYGVERARSEIIALSTGIRHHLSQLKPVRAHEPLDSPCGIVAFTVEGRDAGEIKAALTRRGFAVSSAYPYDAPLDFARRGVESIVRVSPHYYNTSEEVERFLRELESLL